MLLEIKTDLGAEDVKYFNSVTTTNFRQEQIVGKT